MLGLLTGALLVLGCSGSSGPQPARPAGEPPAAAALAAQPVPFVDATRAWGLAVRHANGALGEHRLFETMGAGACLLDVEGDGDLDLYLVASGTGSPPDSENVLLLNVEGRFVDVSASSGADHGGLGMGCVAGDVDGDGDADSIVTNLGPDALLVNDGSGHFTELKDAGVSGPSRGWSTAAVLLDVDGDGTLDLFVAGYVELDPAGEPRCSFGEAGSFSYCEPAAYAAAPDRLLRGLGDGRFEDASAAAALRSDGKGLGASAFDADGDGDLDLFVANDTTPNFLYLNESVPGGVRFVEDGALRGLAYDQAGRPQACMGVATGDIDGDGSLELFVTNFALERNTLYSRGRSEAFNDVTGRSGLGPASALPLGFGTALLDSDLDGDLDLVVANGQLHARIGEVDAAQAHAQPDQLFLNDGRGRFAPADGGDLAEPRVSRGLVTGDLDGDGVLDLVITENAGPARLLLGRAAPGNRHLELSLQQEGANRDAVGASVTVHLPDGRALLRTVTRGDSYLGSSAPSLHFGVGPARTASVSIVWPDGAEEGGIELETGTSHRLLRRAPRRPQP